MSAADAPLEEIADNFGHYGIRTTAGVYRHRINSVVDSGAEVMEALIGDDS